MGKNISLYGGRDPRELPMYSAADAAVYLGVPTSTLRAWMGGKNYVAHGQQKRMKPLIVTDEKTGLLSFNNFAEAYMLASLTRAFKVPLVRVRNALEYIGGSRPLLTTAFKTDGKSLFIERMDKLIDASLGGQSAIREVVEDSLERVEFDTRHRPTRVFPWRRDLHEAKIVAIDPRRAFGRPTVAGHGVKIEVVIDRYAGGESIAQLSAEYGMSVETVEGVLRWGVDAAKAA